MLRLFIVDLKIYIYIYKFSFSLFILIDYYILLFKKFRLIMVLYLHNWVF